LQIDKDNYDEGMREISDLVLTSAHNNSIVALEIYHHEKLDIAIIKINYVSDLRVYPIDEVMGPAASVLLYGCPHTNGDQVENFTLSFNSVKDGLLECSTVENNVQPNDIDGFSGGGVFSVSEDKIYLHGVEKSSIKQAEFVTRVFCFPISKFEELLELNELARFGASHLVGFDTIQSKTFSSLDTYNEDDLEDVIAIIHDVMTDKICISSLSPNLILSLFREKLLSYRQKHKELEEIELWTDFLEFIAIKILINPPLKFTSGWEKIYLEELFKSYRLLYSSKFVGWRKLYKELVLPSSFKGLIEAGRIIIIGNCQKLPNSPNIEHQYERTIRDISAGLERDGIDNTRDNRHMNNPIIHWHKLNDVCLVEKQNEYAVLNRVENKDEIVSKLKEDYGRHLLTKDKYDD
jgi:hypothetical protein